MQIIPYATPSNHQLLDFKFDDNLQDFQRVVLFTVLYRINWSTFRIPIADEKTEGPKTIITLVSPNTKT